MKSRGVRCELLVGVVIRVGSVDVDVVVRICIVMFAFDIVVGVDVCVVVNVITVAAVDVTGGARDGDGEGCVWDVDGVA